MSDLTTSISLLFAAMSERIEEVRRNCWVAFKNATPIHSVSRVDLVTGVRIPGGFCWTSSLTPRCSVRFIGRGDGTCPSLHGLAEFITPQLWQPEEFEAFLHIHQRPDAQMIEQMRQADSRFAQLYPQTVSRVLQAMPSSTPAMTMMALGLSAMEGQSKFLEAKRNGQAGVENMLALSMIDAQMSRAWVTRLVAEVYYRCQGLQVPNRVYQWQDGASWVENLARMLGGDSNLANWLNLYMITNSDNEGGNASMHAARLISSTDASFFASAAGCSLALSGRRHGDAVADAYSFMKQLFDELKTMSEEELFGYMKGRKEQEKGFRWPGLGHGVFQVPDERFLLQCEFAKQAGLADTDFFSYMMRVAKAGSRAFSKPPERMVFPNVDFASGSIHAHFFGDSPKVMEWFTCLFLVSRLIGARAQTTAERALGLPIERPSTLSLYEMMGETVPDQVILDLSSL